MPQYVVYRHGWNSANQDPNRGLPEKMAVARLDASSADEACRLAREQVTLEPNQRLAAEPADVADVQEWERNLTARTHA